MSWLERLRTGRWTSTTSPSDAVGKAIPHGVYDLAANEGFVSVGVDHDTPVFAVRSIEAWWSRVGAKRYPEAREIFITADAGGSNSYRSHLWKHQLQRVADKLDMSIHVSHFPARHQQVEQGRASPVLVHLDQLARTRSTDLRDRHQPHRQHDQPRWSRRARPTRSSALSHRQEDLKEGTARTEGRARRVSRRVELRHPIAHGTALTGRLRRSRSLSCSRGAGRSRTTPTPARRAAIGRCSRRRLLLASSARRFDRSESS